MQIDLRQKKRTNEKREEVFQMEAHMWTGFGLLIILVVVGVVLHIQKTNEVTEWLLKKSKK
jgi:hypothetical protein